MQSDDIDHVTSIRKAAALPSVGGIRLIALSADDEAQRRYSPRRRIIASFAIERRRADRRRAKPGIDGLLRMVLADDWM